MRSNTVLRSCTVLLLAPASWCAYPWGLNGRAGARPYVGAPACTMNRRGSADPGSREGRGCPSYPEMQNSLLGSIGEEMRICKLDPYAIRVQEEFAMLGSCSCPSPMDPLEFRKRELICTKHGEYERITVPAVYGLGSELSAQFKALTYFYEQGMPWIDPMNRRKHCTGSKANKTQAECFGVLPLEEPCSSVPNKMVLERSAESAFYWSRHEDGSKALVSSAYLRRGHFWWIGQLLARLLRPSAKTVTRLESMRRRWGWRSTDRVLSLHVRRGDTCADDRSRVEPERGRICQGLEAFSPHVKRMVAKYRFNAVFLATDDQAIVDQARSAPMELLGVNRVFAIDENRTIYNQDALYDRLMERVDVATSLQDTDAFVADMMLLALGDGFVGKFTSNVARLAFALSNAWKGGNCVVPYVSLDSLWCADWGQQTGKSLLTDEPFFC